MLMGEEKWCRGKPQKIIIKVNGERTEKEVMDKGEVKKRNKSKVREEIITEKSQ